MIFLKEECKVMRLNVRDWKEILIIVYNGESKRIILILLMIESFFLFLLGWLNLVLNL